MTDTEPKSGAAAFASRSFVCLLALLALDQFVLVDDPAQRTVVAYLALAAAALPLAALLFFPLAVCPRLSRFALAPMAAWMTLHGVMQLYLRSEFGMFLDGDWIGIVRASSPAEMRWFFGNVGLAGWIGLLATLAAALWVGRLVFRDLSTRPCRERRSVRLCGWIALAAFFGYSAFVGGAVAAAGKIAAVGFVFDSIRCSMLYGELEAIAASPRFPSPPAIPAPSKDVAAVLVLGESSARSHWGLYGYGRDTTAALDEIMDELVVFSNVTAVASETSSALRRMFVADGFTLTQAAAAAGARTALVSNQERWGQWGGLESYVFAGARQTYLQEEGLAEPHYDDALLPYLQRELTAAHGSPSLSVLHLMGSHCPPSRHYPPSAARFPPEPLPSAFSRWRLKDQRNHYDNTICFTAMTTRQAIDALKARGGAAYLAFVSDHGESPDSDRWRDANSADVWQVPALMWFSREYLKRFPESVRRIRMLSTQPLTAADFTTLVFQCLIEI